MGIVKKEEVMIFMTEWINKVGISITQEQLSQLIESAVYEMNQYKF